jgi:hypothetical protein
MKKKE